MSIGEPHEFRGIEFEQLFRQLLEAHPGFNLQRANLTSPSLSDFWQQPDLVAIQDDSTYIFEIKGTTPLTQMRLAMTLAQMKHYRQSLQYGLVVLVVFYSLQSEYKEFFEKENILVWDAPALAQIFQDQLHLLRDTPLYHFLINASPKPVVRTLSDDFISQLKVMRTGRKEYGAGRFGMICGRKSINESAVLTCREHWIAYQKMIIFLNDDDIIQMLILKRDEQNPEEVIRQKIEDFRLSL